MEIEEHYKNLGSIILIGFIFYIFKTYRVLEMNDFNVTLEYILCFAYTILLLITLIYVFYSTSPTTNKFTNFFIWFTLGSGLVISFMPSVMGETGRLITVILYLIIGVYMGYITLKQKRDS